MTKAETAAIREWNIAMGQKKDAASFYFEQMQNLARNQGVTCWCCMDLLLQELLKCEGEETHSKALALYRNYIASDAMFDALIELLHMMP